MARMLRCLIYFTVFQMMASAQTEDYSYQNTYRERFVYPTEFPLERPKSRTLERYTYTSHVQPTPELLPRNEDRKLGVESSGLHPPVQRLENGTLKLSKTIQLKKRGALEESISSPNDRVVFPGPSSKGFHEPRIPEECRKKGYCDSVSDYPSDYVKKLVAEHGHKVSFQMDSLDEDDDIKIAQRLGGTGTDQEFELCNYVEQIYMPSHAIDKEGNWHTVANPPDHPLQGFRVETCNNTGSSCSKLINVERNYNTICKQKFAFRMMVTVKPDKLEQNALKVPSCCSCVIISNESREDK